MPVLAIYILAVHLRSNTNCKHQQYDCRDDSTQVHIGGNPYHNGDSLYNVVDCCYIAKLHLVLNIICILATYL